MRLSTIKLAGFKSFVDPTTLHLPTNMTGVVGPNGCGKSNIIDAVRWVMGESSASRLRGESLADVIFSGSSSRKPVSQATVELLFDNSDQAIGGEFAKYNEISVKRLVSRDGQSAYFLNGTRCRRRDITDLFLGTGLGPRSYSIIEQGMISQVIDAKPEDLRLFLEEAAGISKYKERRRETESRIKGTRDNLDRLNDLREEIDKQLEHLKRQSRAAEQYQALQTEHREKDAQRKALEYRRLHRDFEKLNAGLLDDETKLQELLAEQRAAEAQSERTRDQHAEASQNLGRAQADSYRIGGDLARIEQHIQHQRELKRRIEAARAEADEALVEVLRHMELDAAQLASLEEQVAEADPRLEMLRDGDEARQQALRDAETKLVDWQRRWDDYARHSAEASRAAEVERTKIEFLERQSMEAKRRRESFLIEREGLDLTILSETTEALALEHETKRAALDVLADLLESRKAVLQEIKEQQNKAHAELADLRKAAQAAKGRMASLEALQHAALGQEKSAAVEWLKAHRLADLPRLGEVLDVEPGWEAAVESVLGHLLEAIVHDDAGGLRDVVAQLPQGRVAVVDARVSDSVLPVGSLAAKVKGPSVIRALLASVFAVDDWASDAAMSRRATLGESESLIGRDGVWEGRDWLRFNKSGEAQSGALAREREINELRQKIAQMAAREQASVSAQNVQRDALLMAEQARDDAQRTLYLSHRTVSEMGGQLQSQRGRLEAAQDRITTLDAELAQLAKTNEDAHAEVREARARLEVAVERMGHLETQRLTLENERRLFSEQHETARSAAREVRETVHQLALVLEAQRTRISALHQSLSRLRAQQGQLTLRREELAMQLLGGDTPIHSLDSERQLLLEQRVIAEKDLASARSALDGIEQELRNYEHRRQQLDQAALAQREHIARRRMDAQALDIKAQQQVEAIAAAGLELDAVVAGLPEQATIEAWTRSLGDLEGKLRRLEPVNLAAIQEFAEQSERKAYLDTQNADLVAALEQLEDAIRRIDRETRGRFKETFDRVNAGVQELFPRLFGGGHAYLELTGEDLLDTGVAIMARPPGKRVSNINLLSGGEKALTAVALVFAIFRLNPAPFCLLDEVDAPLDEANVGRFCSLVTEMSEKVQFLFVSHNKATMEAAQQLAGVTMREPGVSRLVSVDLAEATRLVGAA